MTLMHGTLVARALDTLADLRTHAEALRRRGMDVDATIGKLTRLLLREEAEEADGCLPANVWNDVMQSSTGGLGP